MKTLNFDFYDFFFFFAFSLTWGYTEVNNSNDISSECTQQIHCHKVMHSPSGGLYQSCSKNCEISNFGFLPFFYVLFNIGPHQSKSF